MNEHLLQIMGTAMGTKMAPPYSNLFMGRIEEPIIETFIWALLIWKRFIDDIFLIFLGTSEELLGLQNFMNSSHPNIKFTFQSSLTEIPFLDVLVYVGPDRKIQTTLYKKPTDCSPLLHFKSHHSLKCKESIIYSQALRYNLIISEDHNLQRELDNLTKTLLARDYPFEIISRNIQKALCTSRNTLLNKPRLSRHIDQLTPLVTPFTPQGQALSQTIHQNWHIIQEDTNLSSLWPSRPVTAYKKTKSLKDILVHSRQQVPTTAP